MISIGDIVQSLKKRWILIVSITILSTIVAGLVNAYVLKPQYRTSTKLFVGKELTEGTMGYQASEIQMYQKLMKTYAGLIQSQDLIQRAIEGQDVDMSAGAILGSLQVSPGDEDQFLSISIVTLDKAAGKEILELITDEFIKTSTDLIPNGNVQIVTAPKEPGGPFSPNKKMNIAIAFMLGAMVSVGLVLLLEYLDNSVKNKEETEKLLGIPVIGMIPEFSDKELEKEKKRNNDKRLKKNKISKEVKPKGIKNKDKKQTVAVATASIESQIESAIEEEIKRQAVGETFEQKNIEVTSEKHKEQDNIIESEVNDELAVSSVSEKKRGRRSRRCRSSKKNREVVMQSHLGQ